MGENIGAAARVMKNFSITELRIVAPRDGWPNDKAISTSVGAVDIINNAKIFDSVADAVSDLNYVYAASAAVRSLNKEIVSSVDLAQDSPQNSKIGILFGRESSGLSNEEIIYANKIVTINTDKDFTSLNLAQAVGVICYSLFKAYEPNEDSDIKQDLATCAEFDGFYDQLFTALENKSFFKDDDKKIYMKHKIKNLFAKMGSISTNELQILRGIVKKLSN